VTHAPQAGSFRARRSNRATHSWYRACHESFSIEPSPAFHLISLSNASTGWFPSIIRDITRPRDSTSATSGDNNAKRDIIYILFNFSLRSSWSMLLDHSCAIILASLSISLLLAGWWRATRDCDTDLSRASEAIARFLAKNRPLFNSGGISRLDFSISAICDTVFRFGDLPRGYFRCILLSADITR